MQISSVSPINFSGMTKYMKKQIHIDGQYDIDKEIQRKPERNQTVGQLPKFIFDKLPKENREAAIKEILNTFDDVALSIRGYVYPGFTMDSSKMNRPEIVNQMLTDVFHKYNIIPKYETIDVKYLDQGGKGKVFKLDGLRDNVNDDEFVIKVFHQIKGEDWHPYKSHGCYAEINNGMYWRHHEGFDTHRGKFFFANLKSGYIVSKYIDEDVPIPKRVVDEYKYGIKCTDEAKDGPLQGYNRMKGYNYDYGGMRVVNRLKNGNKVARITLEKIRNLSPKDRIIYWNNMFYSRKATENLYAGLALGIKYLPEQDRNSYIDKCAELDMPLVDRALGYVLKYLPHEDALKYFEQLLQTEDEITQVVLFNEIPLLSKIRNKDVVVKDDINISLGEINSNWIYDFYKISEKYAMPNTVEHLGSFVHLLPKDKISEEYAKLLSLKNPALNSRLRHKVGLLPKEIQLSTSKKLDDEI